MKGVNQCNQIPLHTLSSGEPAGVTCLSYLHSKLLCSKTTPPPPPPPPSIFVVKAETVTLFDKCCGLLWVITKSTLTDSLHNVCKTAILPYIQILIHRILFYILFLDMQKMYLVCKLKINQFILIICLMNHFDKLPRVDQRWHLCFKFSIDFLWTDRPTDIKSSAITNKSPMNGKWQKTVLIFMQI